MYLKNISSIYIILVVLEQIFLKNFQVKIRWLSQFGCIADFLLIFKTLFFFVIRKFRPASIGDNVVHVI